MNREIGKFRNIHPGGSVFVMASGVSLSQLDLSKLKGKMVIGLNRSVLIYPNPNYHCVMDLRLFKQYSELLESVPELFTFKDRPFGTELELIAAEGFSWNLENGIYSGYIVSYFALQIAVFMGFKNIFYLGLDLKNVGEKTHFFGHDFHSANHDRTEFPKMIKMMEYGAETLRDSRIKVYNCSPISQLKGFPFMSYEEALVYF